jgi:DNA-binding transcriptional LysR family regulator
VNTLLFKYAAEIEKTRSITRAAENLLMAQPNLSKAVKTLENKIGFPVFERTTKGVVPTRKGVEFLVSARRILDEMGRINSLINTGV